MTTNRPFITAGASKVFQSSSSNVLTFYDVQSEDISKNAGLMDMPMPTQDSDGKIVMDLMGTGREILITGIVGTADVGTGKLYLYAADIAGLGVHTLVNGQQGTAIYGQYVYTPETLNRGNTGAQITINVVVSDASIKSVKGDPESMEYSVTLLEFGTLV